MPVTFPRAGDLIPHFEVTTIDGERVRYADLWQHRNVVVLSLSRSAGQAERNFVPALRAQLSALQPEDTALVAFRETTDPSPSSTLVIADRWGEVAHAEKLPPEVSTWPTPAEVVDWVEFIRRKCPECPPW